MQCVDNGYCFVAEAFLFYRVWWWQTWVHGYKLCLPPNQDHPVNHAAEL